MPLRSPFSETKKKSVTLDEKQMKNRMDFITSFNFYMWLLTNK